MALVLATYVDPGTYIGEVIVPGAVNVATVPFTLGVVGAGSRQKQVTNEAVQRGLVENQALTFYAPSGTGTGVSISAPSGGLQTLTDTGATFTTQVIGSTITIRNDTVPANNGTFKISDRPSATTVVYSNPAGGSSGSVPARTYAVTPSAIIGGGSPFRTNRSIQTTSLFRDGKVVPDTFLSFKNAYIETSLPGPFALSGTVDAISLEFDGKVPLTLIFTSGAGATTVNGTQVTVANNTIPTLATATLAQVAAAINEGLNPADGTANAAVSALGYGAPYGNAAQVITGTGLRITSPTVGPSSDVRVSDPVTHSAVTTIFGSAGALNRDAPSVLSLQRVAYNSGSTYTLNFVNVLDTQDPLANTGIQSVARIGTAPGIGIFTESVDFALAGDQIDWSLGSAAYYQVPTPATVSGTGTVNLSGANTTIRLSFDQRAAIDIQLVGLSPAPLNYTAPGTPAATTAAEIVRNINAVVAANPNYGSRYQTVARELVVGSVSYVTLQSPTNDASSEIIIATPTTAPANDATLIVLGLSSTALPKTIVGTGRHPTPGSLYFVTYTITRPDTDYNTQKRFLSESLAASDLGTANSANPLMQAVHIAFAQGISSLVVCQVDDSTLPGSPTRSEFDNALDATTNSDLITDLVVLSTDLGVQTDVRDHIEHQSSPSEKHYRRGYFGMPIGTQPGDKDSPGTFVYEAQRTLQVAPDSPGRGRMVLVAPSQPQGLSVDFTQADGSVERDILDSSMVAVAVAAKQTSFTNPAQTLASQTVSGFNTDDIDLGSIWKKPQRATMASQGVMVVTYDAGNFKILDPVTTEVGAGGLAAFSYPSTSAQKDNVSRKIDAALTSNLVGIVPTDLSDFIIDIKIFIARVLEQAIGDKEIGPFVNPDKSTREIDLSLDIEVYQDANDPTKFFFKFFYMLRYPALRFFGEFSVDSAIPSAIAA